MVDRQWRVPVRRWPWDDLCCRCAGVRTIVDGAFCQGCCHSQAQNPDAVGDWWQPQGANRLNDLFYLGELERQADIFVRSFTDAMRAVDADTKLDVWRHLQATLFAGIIAHRLVRARARQQASNDPSAGRPLKPPRSNDPSRAEELQQDPSIGLTWDELDARMGSRWK